jgi:hypothetical protein
MDVAGGRGWRCLWVAVRGVEGGDGEEGKDWGKTFGERKKMAEKFHHAGFELLFFFK